MRKVQLKRVIKLYRKIYHESIFTKRAGFIYELLMNAEGYRPPYADVPF